MANLHQLNIQYLAGEDRLLLRISLDDASQIGVWITRRYCKLLLSVLDTLINGNAQQQAKRDLIEKTKKEFEQAAATSNVDFATPLQQADSHPLGEEPLLAHQLAYRALKEERMLLTLGAESGKKVNLNLDPKLLHTLNQLILKGVEKADWAISDGIRPLPESPTSAKKALH